MTDPAAKADANSIYANAGNTLFGLSGSLREIKINQAVDSLDQFSNPTYDQLSVELKAALSDLASPIDSADDFILLNRQVWVDAINHGLSKIESVSGIQFNRLDPQDATKADINWGVLNQNLDLEPSPYNPLANPKANAFGNLSVAEEHRQDERGLSQIWFYDPIIDPKQIYSTALHELLHAFGAIDDASDSPQESIVGNEALSGFEFLGTDVWSYDLGILDVYALQSTWGVNTEKYKANTTYVVTGADTWGSGVFEGGVNVEADLLNSSPQSKAYQTIWDADGLDTIDASGATGDSFGTSSTIDLRQGFFSSIGGLDDNVGIAFGAVIENAIGSDSDDIIVGNLAANTILANDGADYIFGSAEALREFQAAPLDYVSVLDAFDLEYINTLLLDSSDEDWTYGGLIAGQPVINDVRPFDGDDNDVIFGGEGGDRIFSGGGNDTVISEDGDDIAFGGEGNDAILGGKGDDELIGGGGNDTLIGGDDADTLYGDAKGGGNDGSTVNYLVGGGGNDHIHLGYNDFAIGGEGQDTFYVYTEIDNPSSFDLKSVFILDFNPEQDQLFVNGVQFTGYQASVSGIQQLATVATLGDGHLRVENDVYILDEQISGSFGSNLLQPNITPSTIDYFADPDAPGLQTAFRNGNYRDVSVSNIGSLSSNFGLVSFVDADMVFPTSNTDSLSFNLNDYLNVFVGELWADDDSFFSRDRVQLESRYGGTGTVGWDPTGQDLIENFNLNVPWATDQAGGELPDIVPFQTLTGFNADQKTISSSKYAEARAAAAALAQNGAAALSSARFAASQFSAPQSTIQAGAIANESISFIYDNLIEITLPPLSADIQFVAFEGLLQETDLSKFSISEFGNILSLNELGLVPDNSLLTSVSDNIGVVQFGSGRDEILSGSSGNDLLVGGGGNDGLVLNTDNANDVDLLVGGSGDDEYILSGSQGAFDKIVIAERLADDEVAGGNDILRINANSTEITVVEGNSINDLRILVPNVPNPRDPDPISDGFGIIDVMNQLGDNPDDWIEEIHFSDRVIWTRTQLIAAAVAADPVSVGTIDDVTVAEDNAVEFSVQDAFIDTYRRDFEYSATLANGDPLPEWLSIVEGDVTGTPPSNFNGQLDISVTGTIGAESVTTNFSLTISPVNDAPVLSLIISDQTSLEDEPINIAVPTGTFTDVEGDVLTLSAALTDGSALPAWLQFDGSNFIGIPPAGFSGDLDLTVTASDGSLYVSDDFILTIEALIVGTGIPYPDITNIVAYDSYYMEGTSANDSMSAASSSNNTNMVALGGNDLLISESWNSSLQGRDGIDVLVMRAGGIRAYGDAEGDQYGNVTAPGSTQSADYFVFDVADYVGASYELDPLYVWADIKDYADGVDKIAILNGTGGVNSFGDLTITQNGTSVDISTPTIPKIVLENTVVADIDASDFIFGDGSTASAQSASALQNIFVDDYRRYTRNSRLQAPVEGRFREPGILHSDVPELNALRAGLSRESFGLSSRMLTRDTADIFDYYDQLNKNPYKQPSSFAQSQMATTPDVVSKEAVSASSSAANNADALKIALMTQDMNMFGASSAATSMKMRDRGTTLIEHFAA